MEFALDFHVFKFSTNFDSWSCKTYVGPLLFISRDIVEEGARARLLEKEREKREEKKRI